MTNNNFYNSFFLKHPIILSQEHLMPEKITILPETRVIAFIPSSPSQEEMNLLHAIMNSCKITENQFQVIPLPYAWKHCVSENIKEVILFGVTEKELQLSIELPHNWPINFDKKSWIKTNTLGQLIQSKELKNDLWHKALKPQFFKS